MSFYAYQGNNVCLEIYQIINYNKYNIPKRLPIGTPKLLTTISNNRPRRLPRGTPRLLTALSNNRPKRLPRGTTKLLTSIERILFYYLIFWKNSLSLC